MENLKTLEQLGFEYNVYVHNLGIDVSLTLCESLKVLAMQKLESGLYNDHYMLNELSKVEQKLTIIKQKQEQRRVLLHNLYANNSSRLIKELNNLY